MKIHSEVNLITNSSSELFVIPYDAYYDTCMKSGCDCEGSISNRNVPMDLSPSMFNTIDYATLQPCFDTLPYYSTDYAYEYTQLLTVLNTRGITKYTTDFDVVITWFELYCNADHSDKEEMEKLEWKSGYTLVNVSYGHHERDNVASQSLMKIY